MRALRVKNLGSSHYLGKKRLGKILKNFGLTQQKLEFILLLSINGALFICIMGYMKKSYLNI